MNCAPNPECCEKKRCRVQIFNQPQLQFIGYPIGFSAASKLLPVQELPTAFGVSLAFTEREWATGEREREYPSSGLIRGMY